MNKQEAIKRVEELYGYGSIAKTVTDIISQIHEPQKVVVPKHVAEWIEELKKSRSNLAWVWEVYPNEPKIKNWLESNTEKFMRAWLDGYEIEQEQMYTVEIPNPNADGYSIVLGRKEGKVLIKQDWSTTWEMNCSNQLTEAEIKQDFEWAWQFATPVEVEL
ncbi:DUF1642 domain-containing protein [Streptococcus suis]